jgi:gas vesicle protein
LESLLMWGLLIKAALATGVPEKFAGAAVGAVLAVLVAGGLGVAAWQINDAAYERGEAANEAKHTAQDLADEKQARRDERLVQSAVDAIGGRLSLELRSLRIQHTTINKEIRDEVRTVPIYSECRISDGMWRRLNELRAATGAGAPAGSGGAVPGAPADR